MNSLFRKIRLSIRYLGTPPWDTQVSPPELLDFMQTHQPGNALDLGCGTGTNCLTLARAGWITIGVDLAWVAIYKAKRRFATEQLSGNFIESDVTRVELPDMAFDLILDIGCFHSLPPLGREVYEENIFRWLKPGGSFLLYGHMTNHKESEKSLITEEQIDQFSTNLTIQSRKDCVDAWHRQTIWLWFMRPGR